MSSVIPRKRKKQPEDLTSANYDNNKRSVKTPQTPARSIYSPENKDEPLGANLPRTQSSGSIYSPETKPHNISDRVLPPLDISGENHGPEEGVYQVLKFGGSSVGSPNRLMQVVNILVDEYKKTKKKNRLAVVVSAQGNTTDWLLDAADYASEGNVDAANRMIDRCEELVITNVLAVLMNKSTNETNKTNNAVTATASFIPMIRKFVEPLRRILEGMSLLKEKTAQGLDYLLSFGERLSALSLAHLLTGFGVPATFIDSRRWVSTNNHFGNAVVNWDRTKMQLRNLETSWSDDLTVHTGFIGQTEQGRTTTLGRNGSDYTATMLGAALRASRVVINTDVPGVMTADPRIVDTAMPVRHLSYKEALDLATYGTAMFHHKTFLPLLDSGVPMLIRNTMDSSFTGTLISRKGSNGAKMPTCVTSLENLALIDVSFNELEERNCQLCNKLFCALLNAKVTVYMETQAAHGRSVILAIPEAQLTVATAAIRAELSKEIKEREVDDPCVVCPVTMLSIVTEGIGTNPSFASTMIRSLGALGIDLLAVSQGSRSFTSVIHARDTSAAVRNVHAAFNFAKHDCSVVIFGNSSSQKGSASTVVRLAQILCNYDVGSEWFDNEISLRVVGVVGTCGNFLFDEGGNAVAKGNVLSSLQPETNQIITGDDKNVKEKLKHIINTLKDMRTPIFVDGSGRDDNEELYLECMKNGVHVVVTCPHSICGLKVLDITQDHATGASVFFDSTVGGGLPLLQTIRSFSLGGDRITKINALLSGSINFVTNLLSEGKTLSGAMTQAYESGFLEENPWADFGGREVASKLCIIAREMGVATFKVEDVKITPFISDESITEKLKTAGSPEEFLKRLKTYADPWFEKNYRQKISHSNGVPGQKVRWKATLEFSYQGSISVDVSLGLCLCDIESTFYPIRGKEVCAEFTSRRHSTYPLRICGAGQGALEGCAGVIGDIVTVVKSLQGKGSYF